LRCGRGWSKTTTAVWIASKFALEKQGSFVLHLMPQLKQVRKNVWRRKLYEKFIIPEFIKKKNDADTYFELFHGSHIELDGSDNFDAHRGLIDLDLVIADEYADFSPEWIDVMFPNVGKSGGTILFLGTPPRFPKLMNGKDHHYVLWDRQCRAWMKRDPSKFFWSHLPTSSNPYYSKQFLIDEKYRLESIGMGYRYEREYLANIVIGSSRVIFKTFSEAKHMVPHEDLMNRLWEMGDDFEYYAICDPGTTTSAFAVLFMAVDTKHSRVAFLDEIYETDQANKTVKNIVSGMEEACNDLTPGKPLGAWNVYYDNAAAWFGAEVSNNYEYSFIPTVKRVGDKEDGIGLLQEVFKKEGKIVSDRCENFALELINYRTDDKGRLIKDADHLIDAARYGLNASGFQLEGKVVEGQEFLELDTPWDRMIKRVEGETSGQDWTRGIINIH